MHAADTALKAVAPILVNTESHPVLGITAAMIPANVAAATPRAHEIR